MSRIEEISRMRDIDDSFEEKYNKLRSIAVRLKKKISDQTKRIEELEQLTASSSAEANLPTILDSSKSNDTHQLRNLQKFQKQNDTLQDELDELRITDKRNVEHAAVLAKQLLEVTTELKSLKEVNANIQTTVETNSSQKSSLDQAVKEYVKQITALKEELADNKKEKEELNDASRLLKGNFISICTSNTVYYVIRLYRQTPKQGRRARQSVNWTEKGENVR